MLLNEDESEIAETRDKVLYTLVCWTVDISSKRELNFLFKILADRRILSS
jgi:hypothetical protein